MKFANIITVSVLASPYLVHALPFQSFPSSLSLNGNLIGLNELLQWEEPPILAHPPPLEDAVYEKSAFSSHPLPRSWLSSDPKFTSSHSQITKRDGLTDIDILNFALTLEHLENNFYREGLKKYSEKDFTDAGHPSWTRGRYQQIAAHERTHVEFLSSAITSAGAMAVEACEYEFPDTDVNSFIDISYALESVGTSAYNGVGALISNKAYLTVAASIMGVEARQASWINSAVRKSNGWNTAFETPLDMNQVYTMASAFIKSCPSSNPALYARAFPKLTVPACTGGQMVRLSFDAHINDVGKPLFVAFLSGTGTIFAELGKEKEVTIPEGMVGLVFVIITEDGGMVTDETTVAGPAMVQFSFDSEGEVS